MTAYMVLHVGTGNQKWFKTSAEAHQYSKHTDDTYVVKMKFRDRDTQSMIDFLNKFARRA